MISRAVVTRIIALFLLIAGCTGRTQSTTAVTDVCFGDTCFRAEVADTEEARQRGLQFRHFLEPSAAMLFVFPSPGIYHFWMKDTYISLDIIWLDEQRSVVFVASDVPACRHDPCPTYGPAHKAQFILEINAGMAQQAGIRVGDRAEFTLRR